MDNTNNIMLSCRYLSKVYENGLLITKVLTNINLDFFEGSINLIWKKW